MEISALISRDQGQINTFHWLLIGLVSLRKLFESQFNLYLSSFSKNRHFCVRQAVTEVICHYLFTKNRLSLIASYCVIQCNHDGAKHRENTLGQTDQQVHHFEDDMVCYTISIGHYGVEYRFAVI